MSILLDDLRGQVRRKDVLVIVGAGVSVGATNGAEVASWTGLLKHGARRCVDVGQDMPADKDAWLQRINAEIDSGDPDDLLGAAEKISKKLGAPRGGEYKRWLRETVGALRVGDRAVIEAIQRLGVPVATTNYDGLLEEVFGLPGISWRNTSHVERILRGEEQGILHFHGFWNDSESVVLGISSYSRVMGNAHAQAILHAVRAFKTLLLIGFGGGLADPNFGAFLRWSRQVFAESEYRNFRLAREADVVELQRQHPPEERICVIPYGTQHGDLAPFLSSLAPTPSGGGTRAAFGVPAAARTIGPMVFSSSPYFQRVHVGIPLTGRDQDLSWLHNSRDDCLIVGQPGAGKTSLLREFANATGAVFLVSHDVGAIRTELGTDHAPTSIILDDVHANIGLLRELLSLRRAMKLGFRMVCSCWPGAQDRVTSEMGLPSACIRELGTLDRDELVKVVNAVGVSWPLHVVREIVDQAAGQPGLAVTLSKLCLQGDLKDVLLGRALVRSVGTSLGELIGPQAITVLACFAVGGRAGMGMQAVADFLSLSIADIQSVVGQLAAGGLIVDSGYDSLWVRPESLASALVRDIFFGGSTSLRFLPLFERAADKAAASVSLVAAKRVGAAIPDLQLVELLERHGHDAAWEDFAYLGPEQARLALAKRPGLLTSGLAHPALYHIPSEVIPLILYEAERGYAGTPTYVERELKSLAGWITEALPGTSDAIDRRSALARSAADWLRDGSDVYVGTAALAAAFAPNFEFNSLDPGRGRTFTYSFGLLTNAELASLSELWPSAFESLTSAPRVAARPLIGLIHTWIYPNSLRGVADETLKLCRRTAARMIRDVAHLAQDSPALSQKLHELGRALAVAIDSPIDEDYTALFPIEEERWGEHAEVSAKRLQSLASRLATAGPSAAVARIAFLESEAASVGDRSVSAVWLAEYIAELIDGPIEWIFAVLSGDIDGRTVEPFLRRAIALGSPGWQSVAISCLDHDRTAAATVSVLIESSELPEPLLLKMLQRLEGFRGLVQFKCSRRVVPVTTLRMLLQHTEGDIASGAAIGAWQAEPKGEIDRTLRDDWEKAILHSEHDDYWLREIFAAVPGLGAGWLRGNLPNRQFPWYRLELARTSAIDSLTQSERLQLLETFGVDTIRQSLAATLIGHDLDLYRKVLASSAARPHHLAPLNEMPSERWQERALLALHAGYSPSNIVDAAIGMSRSWSGNESDYWNQWIAGFEALASHSDDRMHEVARRGVHVSQSYREAAVRREQEDEVYGRWRQ